MSNSKVEQRKSAALVKKQINQARNKANKSKKKAGDEVALGENVLFNIRKHLMTNPILVVTRTKRIPQYVFLTEEQAAKIGNNDDMIAAKWKEFQEKIGERAILFYKTGSGRMFCSILSPGPWRVKFMAQGLVVFDMNEAEPFKEPIEYGKWPEVLNHKNWGDYRRTFHNDFVTSKYGA